MNCRDSGNWYIEDINRKYSFHIGWNEYFYVIYFAMIYQFP